MDKRAQLEKKDFALRCMRMQLQDAKQLKGEELKEALKHLVINIPVGCGHSFIHRIVILSKCEEENTSWMIDDIVKEVSREIATINMKLARFKRLERR